MITVFFIVTIAIGLGFSNESSAQVITTGELKKRELLRKYKKNTGKYKDFVERSAANAKHISNTKKGNTVDKSNDYEDFLKARNKKVLKSTTISPEVKKKMTDNRTGFMARYAEKQKRLKTSTVGVVVVQKQLNRMQQFMNDQEEKKKVAGIGDAYKRALAAKKTQQSKPRFDSFLAREKSKVQRLYNRDSNKPRPSINIPPSR